MRIQQYSQPVRCPTDENTTQQRSWNNTPYLKTKVTRDPILENKGDKRSTIVVRQLTRSERDWNTSLMPKVTKIIKDTLQRLKINGLLSPRMADYCLPPPTVSTAQIYFLKNTQEPHEHQTDRVYSGRVFRFLLTAYYEKAICLPERHHTISL